MNRRAFKKKMDDYYQLINGNTDPVTLYLESLAPTGRRSMRSLLNTAGGILGFEDSLEHIPWQMLEYQHLATVRSELMTQGKSANTANLTISALKGVMGTCFNLGLIDADKWMQLKTIKPVRGKKLPAGRSLSQKEIGAIYSVCKQDKSARGKRDLAAFAMMLATGLRRSETADLQVNHYNTRSGELVVMVGKGNKQRKLYLSKDARQMVRPWLDARGKGDGHLFNPILRSGEIIDRPLTSQALYDVIKNRSLEAGIEQCQPHDLRRTFVTRLLDAGVDLNTARQLAGHSNVETTVKYDRRDEQHQKKALKSIA